MKIKPGLSDFVEDVTDHVKQTAHHITIVPVGAGVSVGEYRAEIEEMMEVLLGRQPPPVDVGIGTLMEVAEAYFARATEMEMVIKRGEADGAILKGSSAYKFRTGELRAFLELTKRAIDLGSRRITLARMAMSGMGED